jgi:DNA-binding transcriptional LysR family regulator
MPLALDDLTTLSLFAEVVEKRSFTGAAAAAGMVKATVSRRIAELERRVGCRLLQRTTRSVMPTDEGRRLYEQATRLVATAREATDLLSDVGGQPAGVLRVGAPVAFAQLYLAAAAVDFLRLYPDVQLQLLPRTEPSNLVQEELDIAIRVGTLREASLVARRLAVDNVVAVASRGYIKAHGAPSTLAELSEHEVLRLSWEAQRPGWRFRGRPSRGGLRLQGKFVSSDASVVCEAAALGLGIAMMPSFIVAPAVRSGRLVRLLGDTHISEAPISVVYTARRNLPRRLRAFVDFVVGRYANDKWRDAALLPSTVRT